MSGFNEVVLADTNVIIEAFRTNSWGVLSARYAVETVAKCIEETQTGYQRRRPEQQIDQTLLETSIRRAHHVSVAERAALAVQIDGIQLDAGEEALWAHAMTRRDAYSLCGPDIASMRCGVRLKLHDRLISLEKLLESCGHTPKMPLRVNYTEKWFRQKLNELLFSEKSF